MAVALLTKLEKIKLIGIGGSLPFAWDGVVLELLDLRVCQFLPHNAVNPALQWGPLQPQCLQLRTGPGTARSTVGHEELTGYLHGCIFNNHSVRVQALSPPLVSSSPYFAIPKNTARQRSTSTSASASMRPKDLPTLSRLTVMALSTITCDGFCKPLPVSG